MSAGHSLAGVGRGAKSTGESQLDDEDMTYKSAAAERARRVIELSMENDKLRAQVRALRGTGSRHDEAVNGVSTASALKSFRKAEARVKMLEGALASEKKAHARTQQKLDRTLRKRGVRMALWTSAMISSMRRFVRNLLRRGAER